MDGVTLKKWKGVLWADSTTGGRIALCPKHRLRLELWDTVHGGGYQQGQTGLSHQKYLVCPEGDERFSIFGKSFEAMVRRFDSYQESISLKGATVYDLDNIYTPVLKVEPKPKDKRFSVQVEIDTTPHGKKLVIYAADRDKQGKTQIFLDPETDKISFDSNDLHPNMIFAKVEAIFKDGKSASLEDKS